MLNPPETEGYGVRYRFGTGCAGNGVSIDVRSARITLPPNHCAWAVAQWAADSSVNRTKRRTIELPPFKTYELQRQIVRCS